MAVNVEEIKGPVQTLDAGVNERGAPQQKILFIHQNFPGQFRAIALALANDPAFSVLSIGKADCPMLQGVRTLTYRLHRAPSKATHHYSRPLEEGILHGQAVLRVLLRLQRSGWTPDVVVAHPGWGESLFVKDVFPAARVVHFSEYFYHAEGADSGFDPEFAVTLDDRARIRAKNALQLLNLENCDIAVAPTQWQKSLHPAAYQSKIQVIHEGIDTANLGPDATASMTLPSGEVLRAGEPIVTFVSRNLEPMRGFHVFMRTLPRILSDNPNCKVIIVGGDSVSYGRPPSDAPNWREHLMREVQFDASRVHFLGKIPNAQYRKMLQVSAAHVYLTYPFVLSWSMLEALASGCLLIASRTAPVCEVVRDGENGVLVDFFDSAGIAQRVQDALSDPGKFKSMRALAQKSAQHYSLNAGIAGYRELIQPGR